MVRAEWGTERALLPRPRWITIRRSGRICALLRQTSSRGPRRAGTAKPNRGLWWAQRGSHGPKGCGRAGIPRQLEGQGDCKGRAFPLLTLCLDLPAVHLDDSIHDSQAETGPLAHRIGGKERGPLSAFLTKAVSYPIIDRLLRERCELSPRSRMREGPQNRRGLCLEGGRVAPLSSENRLPLREGEYVRIRSDPSQI